MHYPQLALAVFGIILLAVVAEPLLKRLRIPLSAALVLIGFLVSELLVARGIDTGIRWYNFGHLVMYVLIPVLVFQSALELDVRALWHDAAPILGLSVPLMLCGAALAGGLVYLGIGHPEGFPLIGALLLGVLLSATDPVAVVATLKAVNAPTRLQALLEGESLFNDATAIVAFALLLGIIVSPEQADFSWSGALISFLKIFLGGLFVGLLIGLLAYVIMRAFDAVIVHGVLSIICAYSAFLIAEDLLHVSGVMAVLSAGLLLGSKGEALRNQTDGSVFFQELWELLAYLANAMIFVLAGVTITLGMFADRWLAMLIGIGAVLVARGVVVFGGLGLLNRLPGVEPVPLAQQNVLCWGGVRGAVTLALALSLPLEIEYWYTLQSIAYGVVLFSLFLQAPAVTPLIRRAAANT
jgi:CPA1 family monovalent cation:H+ antiporter